MPLFWAVDKTVAADRIRWQLRHARAWEPDTLSRAAAAIIATKSSVNQQAAISLVAIVAFVCTMAMYFYANRGKVLLAGAVFGAVVFLAAGAVCLWALAWPDHPVLLALSYALLIAVPALCLVAFGLDVAVGWFMLDMSFAVGVAWLLSAVLFLILLGCLLFEVFP